MEGEKLIVSGDKQYVWNQDRNEVIDITNGLSTFFFWPGGVVNTTGYMCYDTFNVSSDRTILACNGYINLAFDFLSMLIDDEITSEFTVTNSDNILNKLTSIGYLSYKIANNRSLLEKIFEEDGDKKEVENNQSEKVEVSEDEKKKKEI
jgi:VIT1/CCC1 family predicted Fe2+/Mn2+ transporter